MFTKKSMVLTLAFVLLVALATLGLSYGTWSEILTINGTVTTGNFDVWFYDIGVYDQSDYSGLATCTNSVSEDGLTLTISVENGYPGFYCYGGAFIVNTGTVPAHINGLNLVSSSGSSSFFDIELKDTGMVPAPSGFDLPVDADLPYTVYGAVDWNFTMPAGETEGEGEDYTFQYTILAEQDTP